MLLTMLRVVDHKEGPSHMHTDSEDSSPAARVANQRGAWGKPRKGQFLPSQTQAWQGRGLLQLAPHSWKPWERFLRPGKQLLAPEFQPWSRMEARKPKN